MIIWFVHYACLCKMCIRDRITYLRTDSVRISEEADLACKNYIRETYGEENIIEKAAVSKTKGKIQDAHEAIRPTYVDLTPVQRCV